ncbi:MAG TPA: site-specific integrase, partial [Verrucomicrobiae bacterium]|nr:site-specific integrase [Verrucomicrobiae bacterium]
MKFFFAGFASLREAVPVQTLVEDFLQYLRHERGQSDNTAKTYAALLGKFTAWAATQNLTDWKSVELKHLMAFLQHERERNLLPMGRVSARLRGDETATAEERDNDGSRRRLPHQVSTKRLSSESVYLEIAAL